ncbi:MAG TPA: hypothetical protein V6C76_12655 [Drouetiella sp.]
MSKDQSVYKSVALITSLVAVGAVVLYVSTIMSRSTQTATVRSESTRFHIFMNPTYRGDTFLLDTQTGKSWQMVQAGTGDEVEFKWSELQVVDSAGNPDKYFSALKVIEGLPRNDE